MLFQCDWQSSVSLVSGNVRETSQLITRGISFPILIIKASNKKKWLSLGKNNNRLRLASKWQMLSSPHEFLRAMKWITISKYKRQRSTHTYFQACLTVSVHGAQWNAFTQGILVLVKSDTFKLVSVHGAQWNAFTQGHNLIEFADS